MKFFNNSTKKEDKFKTGENSSSIGKILTRTEHTVNFSEKKQISDKNDMPIMGTDQGIVLFHPHIPKKACEYVADTLNGRWLGQGPKVDLFENTFKSQFSQPGPCIAVGSGTDSLHLAYLLAGIEKDDEVLVPLFTCTATNIPLLYIGAKPVFVDVDPKTLNINIDDLRKKININTKAIVVVHYGGLPNDMEEIHNIAARFGIPVIEDAAHALGAKYDGLNIGEISHFTMYSFQAIKHLTTGDGGLLTFLDASLEKKAKRLRWFGIDRDDKQKGIWENDIKEIGYKYQMTDISAAIGLAGLEEFSNTLSLRQSLYKRYLFNLKDYNNLRIVDDLNNRKEHAAWLFTILVKNRNSLQLKLRQAGVESGQSHYRNDRYSIFKTNDNFPCMDSIDDDYLILPLHTNMTHDDVDKICNIIIGGW
jgi:perosamine synthetase